MGRWILCAFLFLGMWLATACEAQEAGSLELLFSWDEEPEAKVWVWVSVEAREDPQVAGTILEAAPSVAFEPGGELEVTLNNLSYRDDLHVVVEVRAQDNKNLGILYYAVSDAFSLAAGKHTVVETKIQLLAPISYQFEPTLSLLFAGEPRDSVGPDDLVNATVRTRHTREISVVLANDPSFTANLRVLDLETGDAVTCEEEPPVEGQEETWTTCTLIEPWDLTGELPETTADGLYTVYARFADTYGYESEVIRAQVFLDQTGPALLAASVTPEVAVLDDTVRVLVDLQERLDEDAAQLIVTPADPWTEAFGTASRVGETTTYQWTADVSDVANIQSYTFSAVLTDISGNSSGEVPLTTSAGDPVTLQVDPIAPALSGDPIAAETTHFGLDTDTALTVSFALVEPLPPTSITSETCGEDCPEIRIDGLPIGVVTRRPDGDAGDDTWGFTYTYAVDPTGDWPPLSKEMALSLRWRDAAGNLLDTPLPLETPVTFDFQPPAASDCVLAPTYATEGDTLVYSLLTSEPLETAQPPSLTLTPEEIPLFADPPAVEPVGETAVRYTWSSAITGVPDGPVIVAATLVDAVGNTSDGAVCTRTAHLDQTPPTLAGATITPNVSLFGLTNDDPLSFDFALTEAFPPSAATAPEGCADACPEVRIDGKTLGLITRRPEGDVDTDTWGFTFTYMIDLADGWPALSKEMAVSIHWQDAAGNRLDTTLALDPAVVFDLAPPTASDCQLSPTHAKAEDMLVYSFLASEPLNADQPPTLEVTPTVPGLFDAPPEVTPEGDGFTRYTWTSPVAGLEDGEVTVAVQLVDVVGNTSDAAACIRTAHVDATYPAIEASLISVNPVLIDAAETPVVAVGQGATVSVSFDVVETGGADGLADAPSVDIVSFSPLTLPPPTAAVVEGEPNRVRYTTTLTLDSATHGDLEGAWKIGIKAQDLAGNQTSTQAAEGALLAIDFTPPTLVGTPFFQRTDLLQTAQVTPNEVWVQSDTVVLVSFAVSEPTLGPPEVQVGDALFTVNGWSPVATAFDVEISGWGEDGTFPVLALVADRAGNLTGLDLGQVTVDQAPPAPPTGPLQARMRHYRNPWGSSETDGESIVAFRSCPASDQADPPWSWCDDVEGEAPIEPGTQVTIFGAAFKTASGGSWECGNQALAQGPADPDNGMIELLLAADTPRICVKVTDLAGNSSHPARVDEGEWIATMNEGASSNTWDTPHALHPRHGLGPGLWRVAAEGVLAGQPAGKNDGFTGHVQGTHGHWHRVFAPPLARADAAGVYLPHRDEVMLFGGIDEGGSLLDLTSTWNGTTWTHQTSTDPAFGSGVPPPREGLWHAMAYDDVRRAAILVENPQNQVWKYDPDQTPAWDLIQTWGTDAEPPPVIDGYSVDYDARLAQTLLFGGRVPGTEDGEPDTLSNALWTLDDPSDSSNGYIWRELQPEGGPDAEVPPPRHGHATAWDPIRQRLVLFGGSSSPDFADDDDQALLPHTWEWTGRHWLNRTAETPLDLLPKPRTHHRLAWDATRQGMLLVGTGQWGDWNDAAPPLWLWDGETWTELEPDDAVSHLASPENTWRAQLLRHPGIDGLALLAPMMRMLSKSSCGGSGFAGFAPATGHSQWRWQDGLWSRMPVQRIPDCSVAPFYADEGAALWRHGAAWDRSVGQLAVFGGQTASAADESIGEGYPLADTHAFDGGWSPGATIPDPDVLKSPPEVLGMSYPLERLEPAVAYDPVGQRTLLFGGRAPISQGGSWADGPMLGVVGDLWALHLTNEVKSAVWRTEGSWERLYPTDPEGDGDPPTGMAQAMVYDADRQRVVLFGGMVRQDGQNFHSRALWEFDGTSWALLGDGEGMDPGEWPAGRSRARMVHDPQGGGVLLFGGGVTPLEAYLEGPESTQNPGSGDFGSRCLGTPPNLLCNQSFGEELQPETLFSDLWRWDGSAWEYLGSAEEAVGAWPVARQGHGLVHHAGLGSVIVFGGFTEQTQSLENDVWAWRDGAWTELFSSDPTGVGSPEPRSRASLTYQSEQQDLLLYGGANATKTYPDPWIWRDARTERPGVRFQVDLSAAGLRDVDVHTSLAFTGVAGGEGGQGGPSGVEAVVWDGGRWAQMATNEGTGQDLAEVHWETRDGRQLRRLPQRVPGTSEQSLQLGLRTRGPNGPGSAQFTVDYVEARLRYRSVRESEVACDDGVDDDMDDAIDCGDGDCAEAPHCELEGETSCGDGFDNDGDTLADCADPGCAGIAPCEPGPESACDDGHDNDADGLVDCLDEDCAASACPGEDPCEGLACGTAQGQDCGTCPGGLVCVEDIHRCAAACEPACAGKTCGDDGCGGQCGPGCEGEASCDEGVCVCPTECTGWPGSDDGCGGQCGVPVSSGCSPGEEMHPEGYCSADYVLQFTPLAPAPIAANTIGVHIVDKGTFARTFTAQRTSILGGLRVALSLPNGANPDGTTVTAFAIPVTSTLIAPSMPSPAVFDGAAVPFLVLPPTNDPDLAILFTNLAYKTHTTTVVQEADGTAFLFLGRMVLQAGDTVVAGFYTSMGQGCRMEQAGYVPMENFATGAIPQDEVYTTVRDLAYGIGTTAPGQLQIAAGFVCWPDCEGRTCGDDGCGGSCGDPCPDGLYCSDQGLCFESVCGICAAGTVCGTDPSQPLLCAADPAAGCGEVLEAGTCQDTVRVFCQGETLYSQDCQLSGETCHAWTEPASCGAPCDPSCDDLQCGLDGCGQPCGDCPGTHTCVQGLCYNCQPECADRECGDDTCYSVCGTCEESETCFAGRCWSDCEPTCAPGACGGDGCGGTCGTCDLSETCDEGQCVPNLCGGQCGGEALDGTCQCDADCLWDGTCCADVCHSCGDDLSDPYACPPTGQGCWDFMLCFSDCPDDDGYADCWNACMFSTAVESYLTYQVWNTCFQSAEPCSVGELGFDAAAVCEHQVCGAEQSACKWEETGPSSCAEILGCQLNCALPGGCGAGVCNRGGDWEAQGLAMSAIGCGNDVKNGKLSATDCAPLLEACLADIAGSTCGTCGAGTICAADPEQPERCMGEGCGAVGAEGVCEGAVRVYCDDGALYSTDCGLQGEACEVVDGVATCVESCDPSCDDLECGLDGCGNPCGACAEGHTCIDGSCHDCTLDCDHRECGSDGCLSTCGTCEDDETCWSGRCWPDCVPTCEPGGCGSDGCGGTCGTCELGETCQEGTCWPNACEGQCGGTGLGGCLCDADCLWDGNCCADNCATCGATFDLPADCEPTGLSCDGLVSCYLNDCPDGPGYNACVGDCYTSTSVEGILEHDDWLFCLNTTSCAEADAVCGLQRCSEQKGSCWYDDYGPSSCGEILGCHLGCELPTGCGAMCNAGGDTNASGKALPTVDCGNKMGNDELDAADCAPLFDACLADVVGEP